VRGSFASFSREKEKLISKPGRKPSETTGKELKGNIYVYTPSGGWQRRRQLGKN